MSRLPLGTTWARLVVFVLAVITLGDGAVNARGSDRAQRLKRLDARLQVVVDSGTDEPQRVIIHVQPGARDAMRRALSSHGDDVISEHSSFDALTALVHAEDLEALSNGASVISVSHDAIVRPHGLLGGLLGVVGGVVDLAGDVLGGLLNVVGGILDPAEMTGPPVPPSVLRATLGLTGSWTGKGIGVAVIDSGLETSYDFDGRVVGFFDFTGGKSAAASPTDGYGHGTHVA